MANMELVIKIPEEQYNAIKSDLYNTFSAGMKIWGLGAIRNGTPLQKGHGRLIDEREVYKKFCCRCLAGAAKEVLDETPTIIEADTKSEGQA